MYPNIQAFLVISNTLLLINCYQSTNIPIENAKHSVFNEIF